MRKVRALTELEFQELEEGYKTGAKHHFRQRCKGIFLSHQGYSVAEISNLLGHGKDAIYNWLNNYDAKGIIGLQNKSGQGVKARLDSLSDEDQIDSIAIFPTMFPASKQRKDIRKAVITKHFSVYYHFNKTTVQLLHFWDNRQNSDNLEEIFPRV